MTTISDGYERFIDLLITKWMFIIRFAAEERIFTAQYEFAKANNLAPPPEPLLIVPQACRQIEIIKQRIITILPKVSFIDYAYEAPAPLDPKDFAEVFIADHLQCIEKIRDVMVKIRVTQ